MNYLRKTKIQIPKKIKDEFPNNDTLRVGYDPWRKSISLFLVPRKGSGKKKLVASIESKSTIDVLCSQEAKELAQNRFKLIDLLEQYIANNRIPIGKLNYVTWDYSAAKLGYTGNPI